MTAAPRLHAAGLGSAARSDADLTASPATPAGIARWQTATATTATALLLHATTATTATALLLHATGPGSGVGSDGERSGHRATPTTL